MIRTTHEKFNEKPTLHRWTKSDLFICGTYCVVPKNNANQNKYSVDLHSLFLSEHHKFESKTSVCR